MKISYNWLKEFVDIKASPEKLADDLSLFGHEVEKIKKIYDDSILDFEITPNRGDCLSILGMAREVSALYNTPLIINEDNYKIKTQELDKKININIEDNNICPRYTARIIENITIKESPKWIKNKLISYGFRPLNNIVDITNLIMIETGQPLHAFDYDKIHNGNINIKLSQNNQSLITLDGKERKIDEKMIVIDDGEKTYDLSGIMGGYNSEVDSNTKNIILQAAIFDPKSIRYASKKLKHTTDASYRYERSVDYYSTIRAIDKATFEINTTCPKSLNSKIYDIKKQESSHNKIEINFKKINNLIGLKLKNNEIISLLKKLNFEIKDNIVTVPSYRSFDVTIWQDIAEEVARIYGYNNIPTNIIPTNKITKSNQYSKQESIKDLLVNNGFTEIYSYSFANKKLIELLGHNLNQCTQIKNPISPENEYLRPSLDVSIIEACSKNPWAPEINIFEIGRTFKNKKEKKEIVIATTQKKAKNIRQILSKLDINSEIKILNQKTANYLKIRKNIYFTTFNIKEIKKIDTIYKDSFRNINYIPVSDFPPTIRDISIIVNKKIDSQKIIEGIKKQSKNIFLVELFDEFVSDKIGIDKKSLAFHIWMQDLKSPLDKDLADKIINKTIKKLKEIYNAELRS